MMIKKHLSTIVLGTLLLIGSILSLLVGVVELDVRTLLSGMALKILLVGRIPRLLAILCTGVGMSVAGLIMQQLCMNKFVSPSTGATIQSAQFGILLSLVFLPSLGLWGRVLLAFAVSILGTWIFVWFVQCLRFKNTVMVPLVGIMFGNILGGVTGFLAYKFEVTQQLSNYFVGSFALILRGNYELVWLAVPLVAAAFMFANYFNIVGMGRDFSQNLGVNYKLVLFLGLSIAAMITASVVTVVGQISFPGLMIANLARQLLKTHKHSCLIPGSALIGMIAVIAGQIVSRSVFHYAVPISTFITIGGGIYFLYLLPFRKGAMTA